MSLSYRGTPLHIGRGVALSGHQLAEGVEQTNEASCDLAMAHPGAPGGSDTCAYLIKGWVPERVSRNTARPKATVRKAPVTDKAE